MWKFYEEKKWFVYTWDRIDTIIINLRDFEIIFINLKESVLLLIGKQILLLVCEVKL
jgi:hypothetical protein